MRRIAIMNQKGGTGKTTTAVNLAAGLGRRGRSVLVVDVDPQGSASSWLGASGSPLFLEHVLGGTALPSAAVRPTRARGVSVLPASLSLAVEARRLAAEVGAEYVLRERLESVEGYDYLLFDCPPALGILVFNALTAAGEVLIPVSAEPLALQGLVQVSQTIETVRRRTNPGIEMAGILPFRVRGRTRLAQQVLASLRTRFGPQVFATVVRETIRGAEAPSFERSLFDYDPRSTAAADFEALTSEVLGQER